jgi:osomolarity two-component system response regulator SSK1
MSAERLSKVRLGVPSDGGDLEDNGLRVPTVKRNNANTFSISYADPRPGSSRTASSVIAQQRTFLDSSEDEGDIPSFEERDSEHEAEDWARMAAAQTSMTSNAADGTNAHHFQQTPHFSRTMSMPLPSRLNHLQHPHRQQTRPFLSSPATPNHPSSPINSLSVELADSFQMVIQTMLQISPPQILESAKEQYSACSFSVPTPSISAMFTALKTLNYMSANLLKFYPNESSESLGYSDGDAKGQNVFDIGELLQGVGDALSGVAAQAGVDLVLHHGEVGVRHVYVKGDECGISYALLHVCFSRFSCIFLDPRSLVS